MLDSDRDKKIMCNRKKHRYIFQTKIQINPKSEQIYSKQVQNLNYLNLI